LLQGFVSASMQLHVAADRLPPDSEAKPALRRVLDLMARVIEEGRNAVRGLRAEGGADVDLAQALAGIQDELALTGQARYRVIVEGKPRPLNPMIRDDVFRIAREALVNAFRHSGAQAIEVEIEYDTSNLRVLVRDDGGGIDAGVLKAGSEGHWGLPGMRERAGQIGARFTVWSRDGAGTEVELIVPGPVAYARRKRDA
jgi:signal transduction histidine kinase